MNNIIFYESQLSHDNLLPLAFTRPVADFRVGITTIRDKWLDAMPGNYNDLTVDYLREKYPAHFANDNIFLNSGMLPSPQLVEAISALVPGGGLVSETGDFLAYRGDADAFQKFCEDLSEASVFEGDVDLIRYLYDIFALNGRYIEYDYKRLVAGKKSCPLDDSNTLVGNPVRPDGLPALFIEEGASVQGAVINVTSGPVYVGRGAHIMEGSCVRGPLALCHNSHINMGTKVYSDTTIGPWSKVGGELNNVVIFGYSNKAHDGYLGNAVIGEWCNIGAGTNASNLKNDYSKIRLWNYARHTFMRTDLQFCGLIMGDHSKAGINCMFNTATVVGVGVNIHGSGFPRTFIPSFSEGSPAGGFTDVPLKKFFDIADRVMARRGRSLDAVDHKICEAIYDVADKYK